MKQGVQEMIYIQEQKYIDIFTSSPHVKMSTNFYPSVWATRYACIWIENWDKVPLFPFH